MNKNLESIKKIIDGIEQYASITFDEIIEEANKEDKEHLCSLIRELKYYYWILYGFHLYLRQIKEGLQLLIRCVSLAKVLKYDHDVFSHKLYTNDYLGIVEYIRELDHINYTEETRIAFCTKGMNALNLDDNIE